MNIFRKIWSVIRPPLPVSNALAQDLLRWMTDAEGDEPSWEVRHFGLCSYLGNRASTYTELQMNLSRDYPLTWAYPFGSSNFIVEAANGTAHLNERRRAWVRSKIVIYLRQEYGAR